MTKWSIFGAENENEFRSASVLLWFDPSDPDPSDFTTDLRYRYTKFQSDRSISVRLKFGIHIKDEPELSEW